MSEKTSTSRVRHTIGYVIILVVYVALGYFFKTVFLNWIVGPLFLVLTLYYVPLLFNGVTKRKNKTL